MALLIYSIYHAGMAEELEGGSVVTITSLLDIVPIPRNAPARKVREELLRLDRGK